MERMRVRTDLALEAKESFEGSDVEVHGGWWRKSMMKKGISG